MKALDAFLTALGLRAGEATPAGEVPEPVRIPIPANPPEVQIIKSTSGQGSYRTDLSKQTCTCDRFVNFRRTRYQIGDLRRLCRHLCMLYVQMPEFDQVDELKAAMISNGFGIRTSLSMALTQHSCHQGQSDAAARQTPIERTAS